MVAHSTMQTVAGQKTHQHEACEKHYWKRDEKRARPLVFWGQHDSRQKHKQSKQREMFHIIHVLVFRALQTISTQFRAVSAARFRRSYVAGIARVP